MKNFYIVIIVALLVAAVSWLYETTGWLAAGFVVFAMSLAMMHYAVKDIISIAHQKGLYDRPGGRRIHTTPIPRLGGLAFAPIILCTTILALYLHGYAAPEHHTTIHNAPMWISAMVCIVLIGTVDDLVGVRYPVKFAAQIIAALLVVASGFWIDDLGGLFGFHAIPAAVGMPLTVLFIVGIVNAFNLIDGMDGLAAGICIAAFVIYAAYCFLTERFFISLVAFSTIGVLMPFFYSNVRGSGPKRRKLFMGDTGSQTLGFILGVSAVAQIMNNGTIIADENFIMALSPLVVPVFDVVHVVVFRLLGGKHPFHPDMTHIHHRLMKTGADKRRALMLILGLVAFYVVMNVSLVHLGVNVNLILITDIALWLILNGITGSLARNGTERNGKMNIGKTRKY